MPSVNMAIHDKITSQIYKKHDICPLLIWISHCNVVTGRGIFLRCGQGPNLVVISAHK